jgi:hypothetical protein
MTQANELFGTNITVGKAGLTGITGAATTYSTSAVVYSIRGKAYSKAAVSAGSTPDIDYETKAPIVIASGFGTVVVWAFDPAGTVRAYKGSTVELGTDGNFIVPPQFPELDNDATAFAYTVHKKTGTGPWTFGVSNWNAAGAAHFIQDVVVLPDRPQTN